MKLEVDMEARGVKASLDEIARRDIKTNQDRSLRQDSLCKNCTKKSNLQTGNRFKNSGKGNKIGRPQESKSAVLEVHAGKVKLGGSSLALIRERG